MKKNSLQKAINGAFRYALCKQQEFIGVEHLLLALLNDCEVALFLSEQGISLGELHSDVVDCVKRHTPVLRPVLVEKYTEQRRTQPTQGFERVLQRASFLAECAGKEDVPTPYALLAIFAEHDSFALYLLERYGIKRGDVADYIEHRSYSAGYRIAQRAS